MSFFLPGKHTLWALMTVIDSTAGILLVVIISQAPHFSLVQSDVIVDPEVVQPVVIALRVDLERGMQTSERSQWGRGKTWACRDLDLNQASVS